MRIEYVHASKFGNGSKVAQEFQRDAAAKGVTTNVHHVRDVDPMALPPADLYLFSSPGRMGKPIRHVRRFLERVDLPAGTKCAILTTEIAPRPDKKTGRTPTPEELEKWQRVRPIMHEILERKGLVNVGENVVYVNGMRGPLESDWEEKVADFVASLPLPATA
jgi:hypothetical protein